MRAVSREDSGARRHGGVSLLLGVLLLVGGCTGEARNPFRGTQQAASTVLEVDNRYWADMTISVRRGGQRIRLGQVTTNHRQRFQIPPAAGGPGISVQFIADPVGSDQVYQSPIVALGQGETYVWTLTVNIQHSTLTRR